MILRELLLELLKKIYYLMFVVLVNISTPDKLKNMTLATMESSLRPLRGYSNFIGIIFT